MEKPITAFTINRDQRTPPPESGGEGFGYDAL
jgi:hypothetical protein